MNPQPLINASLRAAIAIAVLLFAIGNLIWLLAYGDGHNTLHTSAQSWSYTLIVFTMLALGLDSAAATWITSAYAPPKPPAPPAS